MFNHKKLESYLNSKGLCNKQLVERYKVVASIVGRNPTNPDLEKYDEALFAALRRRYDNKINVFREKHGFGIHRMKIYQYDENAMLAALRKFKFETGFNPKSKDFRAGKGRLPVDTTIRKKFGSWNRALVLAGLA